MKERLDQLRAMDSAAFMALPASSFSPMPKEVVVDPEEIAAASSPYTNLNGYLPHVEGERRRKEMLDVATMLEERYRVLLPPDRVRRAPEPVLSESASRTQIQSRDGDDSETDQVSVVGEKLRLRLPPRSSTSTTPAPSPAATTPTIKKPRFNASSKQSSVIRILQTVVTTPPLPSPTLPHAEASPLSPSPTIDMDIPSSPEPEPEELEPMPSSPLPTAVTVRPQTPISNEVSMVEPSSPDVPLSNGAGKASGIVSEQQQQNHTFLEQKRSFMPFEQDIPVTPPVQEMPVMPFAQEMTSTPAEQEMPIAPNEQERSPEPSDQERLTIPEPEVPTLENQEQSIHDQEMLSMPPEQEKLHTPETERRSPSPGPESSTITRDQEKVSSPPAPDRLPTPMEREESIPLAPNRLPTPMEREESIPLAPNRLPTPMEREISISLVPDRLSTPMEREESISPERRRSLTPLVRYRSVGSEQGKLPPLEERPVTPERERMTTLEPERLSTPPALERPTTPLVEVTGQDLHDNLPEKDPSIRKSIEPPMAADEESEKAETEDKMSIRAESEVPGPRNKPEMEEGEIDEGEVDVEPAADKMDVEEEDVEDGVEDGTVTLIPTVAVIEQAAVTDTTMDVIPDATLTERTVLPDVPTTQEFVDSGPSVVEQTDVPVSEVGLILDRAVTPEQRPRTESVDIEKMPSPTPMPISSISAPRGRGRKRARLDPFTQPNESASAPVRGPRVPKNHVTYIGASGEMEVSASAIVKAAVHRTQRDVARHLNAFGVPVPNAITQMGPSFELPEWVFPPLSPAESEHAHGDFDVIEDFELNPRTPSERQVTHPAPADLVAAIEATQKESMAVNPDTIETDPTEPVVADYTVSIEVNPVRPIVQPTRQSGPKIVIPRLPLPPPESVTYEEDTVSLGDEDT
jgi:hypothetical protein